MPSLYRVEQNKKTTQRNEDHAHLSSKEIQLRRVCTTLFSLEKKEFGKNINGNLVKRVVVIHRGE